MGETCEGDLQKILHEDGFLSKLRYAGIDRAELVHNYKQFVRTVAYHSSLSEAQSNSLERCQAVALRVILQEDYESYGSAIILTGLEKLSSRRAARCLDFSLKCIGHAQNNRFFPKNPNLDCENGVRDREEFKVSFARTKHYKNSAIPYCQKILNEHDREKTAEELAGAGQGSGPRAWTRAGSRAGTTAGPRTGG